MSILTFRMSEFWMGGGQSSELLERLILSSLFGWNCKIPRLYICDCYLSSHLIFSSLFGWYHLKVQHSSLLYLWLLSPSLRLHCAAHLSCHAAPTWYFYLSISIFFLLLFFIFVDLIFLAKAWPFVLSHQLRGKGRGVEKLFCTYLPI